MSCIVNVGGIYGYLKNKKYVYQREKYCMRRTGKVNAGKNEDERENFLPELS